MPTFPGFKDCIISCEAVATVVCSSSPWKLRGPRIDKAPPALGYVLSPGGCGRPEFGTSFSFVWSNSALATSPRALRIYNTCPLRFIIRSWKHWSWQWYGAITLWSIMLLRERKIHWYIFSFTTSISCEDKYKHMKIERWLLFLCV